MPIERPERPNALTAVTISAAGPDTAPVAGATSGAGVGWAGGGLVGVGSGGGGLVGVGSGGGLVGVGSGGGLVGVGSGGGLVGVGSGVDAIWHRMTWLMLSRSLGY